MKNSYLLRLFFVLWSLGAVCWGQKPGEEMSSTLGYKFTPKGRLHVLVVVIRYEDADLMNAATWPNSSRKGKLPEILRGDNNAMFCAEPEEFGWDQRHRNLSDFFWVMSQGQFQLTGEIYPVQVPVTHIPEQRGNFYRRQQEMNRAAVEWIVENDPDFDWSRFDRRRNEAKWTQDHSESNPDSILDYVFFLHRAPGSKGISSACNIQIPGTSYRIIDGHTGIKSYADQEHNWVFFVHEMAHNLYNAPHFMGANRADGMYYYTQIGWGMMAGWISPFFTANAWERWWLGWQEVQTVTENGRYPLGDLLTQHDAIRIPIPGTEQYLWLEHHRKWDQWDRKLFYRDRTGDYRDLTPTAPGLYAYAMQHYASDRSQPRLNPFSLLHSNMARTYNGQGNFDYEVLDRRMTEGKGKQWHAFRRVQPNPIMGQDDFQNIRWDYNGDGRIAIDYRHGNQDGSKQEEKSIFVEEVEGKLTLTGNLTGDAHDALLPGDELGLSGIFPLLNYPRYNRRAQVLAPSFLNGLSIQVEGYDPDSNLLLNIRFDDWNVREDKRWCGRIRLDASTGTDSLLISSGVTLTLDLSGTPDREEPHPVTGTFSNPTRLTIANQRHMILGSRTELRVQRHSRLLLEDQAQIELQRRSVLRIGDGCELSLADDSKLILSRGARLILEAGAIVTDESLEHVQIRGGEIVDRR